MSPLPPPQRRSLERLEDGAQIRFHLTPRVIGTRAQDPEGIGKDPLETPHGSVQANVDPETLPVEEHLLHAPCTSSSPSPSPSPGPGRRPPKYLGVQLCDVVGVDAAEEIHTGPLTHPQHLGEEHENAAAEAGTARLRKAPQELVAGPQEDQLSPLEYGPPSQGLHVPLDVAEDPLGVGPTRASL